VQEVNGWLGDILRAHGRDAPINARVFEIALKIEANERRPSPDNAALMIATLAAQK
jgi:2-dehydropantoate 2-reductase